MENWATAETVNQQPTPDNQEQKQPPTATLDNLKVSTWQPRHLPGNNKQQQRTETNENKTNNPQPTANNRQPTTDSQQPTANTDSQQPTANTDSQQPTANNR